MEIIKMDIFIMVDGVIVCKWYEKRDKMRKNIHRNRLGSKVKYLNFNFIYHHRHTYIKYLLNVMTRDTRKRF